jgi:hypothetical protein
MSLTFLALIDCICHLRIFREGLQRPFPNLEFLERRTFLLQISCLIRKAELAKKITKVRPKGLEENPVNIGS